MKRIAISSAVVACLASFAAGDASVDREGPTTLAQARSLAAERSVPILLEFYTDW